MIYKVYVYYKDDTYTYLEFYDDDLSELDECIQYYSRDKSVTNINIRHMPRIEPIWDSYVRSIQ